VTPTPVRTARGPLHLSKPTRRGYRTACGRVLAGPELVVPEQYPRNRLGRRIDGWARAWQLELVCRRCAAIADQCDTDAELVRRAGW
jgi:hypothetical protein